MDNMYRLHPLERWLAAYWTWHEANEHAENLGTGPIAKVFWQIRRFFADRRQERLARLVINPI